MKTSTVGVAEALLVPLFLRRELIERGWNDRSLRRAVDAGSLTRLRWGSYVDGGHWAAADGAARHVLLARAVLKRAGTAAVLSHSSAAVVHGGPTWGLDLATVHLTRLDGRAGRFEAGVAQHRGALLPDDVLDVGGVPATSASRTAIDLTTILETEAGVVHVSDLLHRGLTTEEQLRAGARRAMGWSNTLGTGVVLRLSRAELDGVGESRFFHLCYRFSLPSPELQRVVRNEEGDVVGRLDFAWPELGCWIEFDGAVKYEKLLRPGERASDVVAREKEREDAIRYLTGWRCLRVTWRDLEAPLLLAAKVRRFLTEGRPRVA